MGILIDGEYLLDPGSLGEPVPVICNMTGKNGQAGTMVSHDSEARIHVRGYEYPNIYSRPIKYTMSKKQLVFLNNNSDNCEQFVKYECLHSTLLYYDTTPIPVWQSRDGNDMYYWGGAEAGSGKCACGMTGTCADPTKYCNCKKNYAVWRSDEGLLTDKDSLPMSRLQFADTGQAFEQGYHTVGKFVCFGGNT